MAELVPRARGRAARRTAAHAPLARAARRGGSRARRPPRAARGGARTRARGPPLEHGRGSPRGPARAALLLALPAPLDRGADGAARRPARRVRALLRRVPARRSAVRSRTQVLIAFFSAMVVTLVAISDMGRTSPGELSEVHRRVGELAGRNDCSECHGGLFGDM